METIYYIMCIFVHLEDFFFFFNILYIYKTKQVWLGFWSDINKIIINKIINGMSIYNIPTVPIYLPLTLLQKPRTIYKFTRV